eukprot:m.227118 g.227118  ORF g.227118 m.227118 type:complete len:73 (-) comp19221_c0_seq7:5-223(-)
MIRETGHVSDPHKCIPVGTMTHVALPVVAAAVDMVRTACCALHIRNKAAHGIFEGDWSIGRQDKILSREVDV